MIFCCNWPEKRSDDRLLDALISWTKNKLGSDESVVREVCRSLWQRASAMTTRTFKELRGWAEDTDPLAKEAVIKSTLAIMAKEISLGDIINAPAPKGIVTRVCPPPPFPTCLLTHRLMRRGIMFFLCRPSWWIFLPWLSATTRNSTRRQSPGSHLRAVGGRSPRLCNVPPSLFPSICTYFFI